MSPMRGRPTTLDYYLGTRNAEFVFLCIVYKHWDAPISNNTPFFIYHAGLGPRRIRPDHSGRKVAKHCRRPGKTPFINSQKNGNQYWLRILFRSYKASTGAQQDHFRSPQERKWTLKVPGRDGSFLCDKNVGHTYVGHPQRTDNEHRNTDQLPRIFLSRRIQIGGDTLTDSH